MSSTSRGKARNRHDTYPTPLWVLDRVIEKLPILLEAKSVLEPAADDGRLLKRIRERGLRVPMTAVDVRVQPPIAGLTQIHGDFLSWETSERFDLAVTNPPFRLAMPMIERAMQLAKHVVFLLRLNFIGSRARHSFMRRWTPDVYVVPDRPSFTGDGQTDSVEYGWFHFHANSRGFWRLLDLTLKAQRNKDD